MIAYKFYVNDERAEDNLIGILPERRKNRRRVNRRSIIKWGMLASGGYVDQKKIFYVKVKIPIS